MTIERDGKTVELTDGEMFLAFQIMRRKFKVEDVENYLEDNGYDVGNMSKELIDSITDDFEDLYNDDNSWYEAIDLAKDRHPELVNFLK